MPSFATPADFSDRTPIASLSRGVRGAVRKACHRPRPPSHVIDNNPSKQSTKDRLTPFIGAWRQRRSFAPTGLRLAATSPCRAFMNKPQPFFSTLTLISFLLNLTHTTPLGVRTLQRRALRTANTTHDNEPKTNRLDGGSAPPKPTPLAAAGVRGNLHYGLPAASLEKIKTNELFLA